jgi:hypothetical protein
MQLRHYCLCSIEQLEQPIDGFFELLTFLLSTFATA